MKHSGRLLKLVAVVALIVGVMAAGLFGSRANRALAAEPQTYYVRAGGAATGNIDVLAFGPSELKVHRGDTVTWLIDSVHNIHFEEGMENLIIVDDAGVPLLNSAVAYPTVKSGDNFVPGANSGVALQPDLTAVFSLVMDVEPGRYSYFCDLHPGMVGVIEVVEDSVAIPSPGEVAVAGRNELGAFLNTAAPIAVQMSSTAPGVSVDGVAAVNAGNGATGRATVEQFAPNAVIIQPGDTVTWTNPEDSVEVHFINSLPYDFATMLEVIPEAPTDANAQPLLKLGPAFLGTSGDGDTVKSGDTFNSGFLAPGQSFSLIFSDPGVYAYFCHIHPGMNGVVIVEAKS